MIDIEAAWNFEDLQESERRFRALLGQCESDVESACVLTQLARVHGLQGDFEKARELLEEARALAKGEPSAATIRIHLETGRVLNSSGDPAAARPEFETAFALAEALEEEFLAVDAAHMIAIVETPENAIAWNERALQLASSAADPKAKKWKASLHNNLGWTYHDLGDFEKALFHFQEGLQERLASGTPTTVRIAKWCVGRCLRSLGKLEEALTVQTSLAEDPASAEDGFVSEEIAECLYALNRTEESRSHFELAHALLSKQSWLVSSEPQRLERLARLSKPEQEG